MSRQARRVYVVSLSTATFLAALVVVWLWQSLPREGQSRAMAQAVGNLVEPQQATDTGTDPVVYSRVQQLRQELALTNLDLAAMGLSQAQAEGVLQRLIDWQAANEATLAAREQAQHQATGALRQAYQKINVGPRNDRLIQQVPTLEAQVQEARQQQTQLLDGFIASESVRLDNTQQRIWAAARANPAVSSDLRYISNLDAAQVKSEQLSLAQRQEQQQARDNQRLAMPQVLAAEQKLLPLPEEFKTTVDLERQLPVGVPPEHP